MNYFILSPSYSTYWCANENGYTSIIANAGIYTEQDKIRMEKYHAEDKCKFIPIDRDILDKAKEQLDNINKNLYKRKEEIEYDYGRNYQKVEEDICRNNNRYAKLYEVAKDCEL